MKRIKAVIAAVLLAFMTFYYAAIRPEPEDVDTEPPEEEPTPTPPVYDDSDEIATLDERRRAYEAEELAERQAERKREAERTAARSVVVSKAKTKPKEKAKQVAVSRGGNYVGQAQSFESTFYTANCSTGCTGITASGYDVRNTIYYGDYRVLAAPKSIPLYSILRVTLADGTTFEGIVLDRGGNIGEGRLDILVKTRDEAFRLGRQTVEIRMIKRGGR